MLRRLEPAARSLAFAAGAILLIAACRLWLADTVPLTDTTEARFGEMARKMVETGDWLTPQHDYGVPYLAKPPLAMWIAALGIRLLGAGELGPRILILVASLGFCAFVFQWCRRELGREAAAAAVLVLSSSMLFFSAAAAVMTDMLLTISVTIALLAFWRRTHGGGSGSELTLFAALGVGLLAKGPLAIVLAAVPIGFWLLTDGKRDANRARIAWLRGALVMSLIAGPWYLAAEWRNPGFLRYFLVGEHIERFLVPGWTGDLYGRAHDVPHGTIWLFLLIGTLPWPIVYAARLIGARARIRSCWPQRRELVVFLGVSALTSLALFTFAGNIIFPYALPAIPAIAIALVALDAGAPGSPPPLRLIAAIAASSVLAIVTVTVLERSYIDRHSQRAAIEVVDAQRAGPISPIYYWNSRYFSAEYYSRGRSVSVRDAAELEKVLTSGQPAYVIVPDDEAATTPAIVDQRTQRIAHAGSATILASTMGAARTSSTMTP